MKVRKGYIYALILAIGLLLWNHAFDVRHQLNNADVDTAPVSEVTSASDIVPWTSAEAVYECAMKAEELGVTIEGVEVSAESLQGSMSLRGDMTALKTYYQWLETEGRFRSILSLSLETDEEEKGLLVVTYDV